MNYNYVETKNIVDIDLISKIDIYLIVERYGLKYLELLWRKAWHDPVSLARQLGGGSAPLLDSHLLAGLGQFHHLLLNLVETYGWPETVFRYVSLNLIWHSYILLLIIYSFKRLGCER